MAWYDGVGPQVAAWLQDKPTLKTAIRTIATPAARGAGWWMGWWSQQ
ncbi:MAG: hypothetical protein HY598_04400 [Candidatus Omnitrophica bacterium]|nr:hypothetical protein [Candidatus Omnitrophota bacterium]